MNYSQLYTTVKCMVPFNESLPSIITCVGVCSDGPGSFKIRCKGPREMLTSQSTLVSPISGDFSLDVSSCYCKYKILVFNVFYPNPLYHITFCLLSNANNLKPKTVFDILKGCCVRFAYDQCVSNAKRGLKTK